MGFIFSCLHRRNMQFRVTLDTVLGLLQGPKEQTSLKSACMQLCLPLPPQGKWEISLAAHILLLPCQELGQANTIYKLYIRCSGSWVENGFVCLFVCLQTTLKVGFRMLSCFTLSRILGAIQLWLMTLLIHSNYTIKWHCYFSYKLSFLYFREVRANYFASCVHSVEFSNKAELSILVESRKKLSEYYKQL